jgi:Fanconi anemia group M protein
MILVREDGGKYRLLYDKKKGGKLKITVDDRERKSGIPEVLGKRYGIVLDFKRLGTGDYIIDNKICIERKKSIDFIQSIIDGRLFSQMIRIRKYFKQFFLVIEGDICNTPININKNAVKGAVINLQLVWRVPIIFSKNIRDTALHIWLIGSQHITVKEDMPMRRGKKPKGLKKRKMFILEGLPGVGAKTASALLKYFGSIEKIICANEEELMNVNGIGVKLAADIRKTVS